MLINFLGEYTRKDLEKTSFKLKLTVADLKTQYENWWKLEFITMVFPSIFQKFQSNFFPEHL